MTDVAFGHGGDGGSQDPNRIPNTIRSICESSQAKRKRGPGRDLKLHKKIEQNKGEPLPLEVVAGVRHYKFVGPNASDFVKFISNSIQRLVPLHYKDWQSVPQEYKDDVYPSLFDFFNLSMYEEGDPQMWAGIQKGIIAECQSRYSSRKNKMKKKFESYGGCANVETAKSCCPKGYEPDKWVKLIDDLFMNSKYQDRCKANVENRKKQNYPSFHGSQSYAQKWHVEEEKNPGSASYIDVFEKTHYKEGHGWANKVCEADWGNIQHEVRASTNAADPSARIDDIGVMGRALGHRRGHRRGVGRIVRNFDSGISSRSPTPRHLQQIQELQQQVQQMQGLQQQVQQMCQEMQEMRRQQPPPPQVQPFTNQVLREFVQQYD